MMLLKCRKTMSRQISSSLRLCLVLSWGSGGKIFNQQIISLIVSYSGACLCACDVHINKQTRQSFVCELLEMKLCSTHYMEIDARSHLKMGLVAF
jgi:hypothetical protein